MPFAQEPWTGHGPAAPQGLPSFFGLLQESEILFQPPKLLSSPSSSGHMHSNTTQGESVIWKYELGDMGQFYSTQLHFI